MIIEGLLVGQFSEQSICPTSDTCQTFACGALSYLCLPNNIETATFLTVEERQFACERMRLDNPSVPEGYVEVFANLSTQKPHAPLLSSFKFRSLLTSPNRTIEAEHEAFRWSEVVRGVLDLKMWLSATAYFAILSGLYSFGLFVSRLLTATKQISLLMTEI